MATKHFVPAQPEQLGPKEVETQADVSLKLEHEREARELIRAVKRISAAQMVVAAVLVVAVCSMAKTVFVMGWSPSG